MAYFGSLLKLDTGYTLCCILYENSILGLLLQAGNIIGEFFAMLYLTMLTDLPF